MCWFCGNLPTILLVSEQTLFLPGLCRIFREQKSIARGIISSQEEAFWRLHRPPVSVCVCVCVCVCFASRVSETVAAQVALHWRGNTVRF